MARRCAESPPLCAAAPWQLWDQERLLEGVQVEQQSACRDHGGPTRLQATALNSQLWSGHDILKTFFFLFFLACRVHIANALFKPIFSFLVFTPGSSRVRSSISANLQKPTNVLFTVTMDNSQFSLSCKIWRLALPNVLKTLAGSTLEDTKRDDWSFFFFLYFEDHSAVWRGCFDLAVQASRSISSS